MGHCESAKVSTFDLLGSEGSGACADHQVLVWSMSKNQTLVLAPRLSQPNDNEEVSENSCRTRSQATQPPGAGEMHVRLIAMMDAIPFVPVWGRDAFARQPSGEPETRRVHGCWRAVSLLQARYV
jgi:hypothetical protein